MQVLKAALAAQMDLLFIEDDLLLGVEFADVLKACDKPTALCLLKVECHNPVVLEAIRTGQSYSPGFYPVQRIDQFYGAQCLFIPYDTLKQMEAFRSFAIDTGEPIDYFFRDFFVETRTPLYSYHPNPVQHLSPPSLVNPMRRSRIAITFGG